MGVGHNGASYRAGRAAFQRCVGLDADRCHWSVLQPGQQADSQGQAQRTTGPSGGAQPAALEPIMSAAATRSAEVVVVGGGIVGASIAYLLVKRGMSVILMDG